MAKSKARKQQMHRAYAQRKADKRRKAHKSGKTGRIGDDNLFMTARHSMVPNRARRQGKGMPKLVQQAVGRMIERARVLQFPGVYRKAAGE